MEIKKALEYDLSSRQVLGDITLPGSSGIANHALVFMLGGKKYQGYVDRLLEFTFPIFFT